MKKFILAAVMAPFTLFASQYLGIHAGTNYPYHTNLENHHQKVGYNIGAHYGYEVMPNIILEGEITYRKDSKQTEYRTVVEDIIESKIYHSNHSCTYMANIKYCIDQISFGEFTPFFGAGFGYCAHTTKDKIKADTQTFHDKMRDNRFAYQLLAGAKYPINESIDANIEYKYFCGREHVKDHSLNLTVAKNF